MKTNMTLRVALGSAALVLVPAPPAEAAASEIDWAYHSEAPVFGTGASFVVEGLTPTAASRWNIGRGADASNGAKMSSREGEAMSKRIAHLRTLDDGWVGPGSLSPNPDVLSWIDKHVRLLGALRGASLIPLQDGSVALRWESGHFDLTAEMRPDLTLYTLVDDLDSDDLVENIEPLTDDALARFLAAHSDA